MVKAIARNPLSCQSYKNAYAVALRRAEVLLQEKYRPVMLIADPLFWTGYVDKVGTGTEDIVNLCKAEGLKTPEYHQEEDFRVVIWRSDPGVIQSDPEAIHNDPELVEAIYKLICKHPSISRAELSRRLDTSERQVRKAIDVLRDKRIRRIGGDSGEWEIIG